MEKTPIRDKLPGSATLLEDCQPIVVVHTACLVSSSSSQLGVFNNEFCSYFWYTWYSLLASNWQGSCSKEKKKLRERYWRCSDSWGKGQGLEPNKTKTKNVGFFNFIGSTHISKKRLLKKSSLLFILFRAKYCRALCSLCLIKEIASIKNKLNFLLRTFVSSDILC